MAIKVKGSTIGAATVAAAAPVDVAELQRRLAAAEAERDALAAKVEKGQRAEGIALDLGASGAVTFNVTNGNGQTVARGWAHRAALEGLDLSAHMVAFYDGLSAADREARIAAGAQRKAAFKARTAKA